MLSEFNWRLIDGISRALEPDERTAVLGDLAESHVTGWKALWDLLGLVVRRQAVLWKDGGPWFALLGLIGQVGLLFYSRGVALELSNYLSTWLRFGSRYGTGLTASEDIARFVFQSLAFFFCSWLSGLALASLSRRTLRINRSLLYLVWGGLLVNAAFALERGMMGAGSPNNRLIPLLSGVTLFYLWPGVVCALPFLLGARRGSDAVALVAHSKMPLVAGVVIIAVLAVWTSGWPQAALVRWSEGQLRGRVIWPEQLLELALLIWPALYLLTTAGVDRPQRTS